jgi:catechol 2,3-dioxygenase-like lactoylglutathione lyase family enzyme
MQPHLRIARPTDQLDAVVRFYRDGLGFEVVGGFRDHDGFDGVMLGHPGGAYHLELTSQRGVTVGRAPNAESLLVLYLPDAQEWSRAVARFEVLGLSPVKSHNPYWDAHGVTFEDPDGYRVVLARQAWVNRASPAA